MAKHFAPLLQKGGGGFGQQPSEKAKQHSGIIVNITAKVGSIGDNGWRWIYLQIAIVKENTSCCIIKYWPALSFPPLLRSWWLVQLQNV